MARRFSLFRRRFRRWAFAFTAASVLVIASSVARAGDDLDGDTIPDDLEAATERNVAVATVPHPAPWALSITSQSVGATVDDKFRLDYEAGQFKVRYFPESSSGRVASSYSLELRNLVEWIDDDGDSEVDPGEIVATSPLGAAAFATVALIYQNDTDPDGGNIDRFTIRSEGGEVTLILMIAQRFMRVSEDRILTPMEAKLDVYVNHTILQSGARVGLELRLGTEDEMTFGEVSWDVKNRFSRDERWINVTGGSPASPATIFFSWTASAKVDGAQGPVLVTKPIGSSGQYTIYMMYPKSASPRVGIFHDPALGVVSSAYAILIQPLPPELPGDPIVFAASLVGMAALVAMTMVIANRRRGRV